jgi:hypothetical protein
MSIAFMEQVCYTCLIKERQVMKATYFIRSLANNSIRNRVAFGHLEMAIAKKKELEAKGDKVAVYRTDEFGQSKRIA